MANMNLNVNMENLTEEERNQLLALVKKSTEEPKVWKPKDEEEYYYIISGGAINSQKYQAFFNDKSRYEIGNCFKTEEEAEFAVERQKIITELKRFAQEHNDKINWNNGRWKYYLVYDYHYPVKDISIYSTIYVKRNGIFFTSKEIAQQAIDTIGADRLKKYYFEVED